jgi:hypothetical protein
MSTPIGWPWRSIVSNGNPRSSLPTLSKKTNSASTSPSVALKQILYLERKQKKIRELDNNTINQYIMKICYMDTYLGSASVPRQARSEHL